MLSIAMYGIIYRYLIIIKLNHIIPHCIEVRIASWCPWPYPAVICRSVVFTRLWRARLLKSVCSSVAHIPGYGLVVGKWFSDILCSVVQDNMFWSPMQVAVFQQKLCNFLWVEAYVILGCLRWEGIQRLRLCSLWDPRGCKPGHRHHEWDAAEW